MYYSEVNLNGIVYCKFNADDQWSEMTKQTISERAKTAGMNVDCWINSLNKIQSIKN